MSHGPLQQGHGVLIVAHMTEVEQLTGPMVHCYMPIRQRGHSKRQDHGECIVAHGTEVQGPECPMVHCNMSNGLTTNRTKGHALWPMG
jgi:hypothetical protein